MTAGQWVDRAINSALIAAGSAANRIMAATLPPADAYRTAEMLACLDQAPDTYVDSGRPPSAVVGDVEPAGAGASASAGQRPGAGGQSIIPTSHLLESAAVRLLYLGDDPDGLAPELRDRAAQFRAVHD